MINWIYYWPILQYQDIAKNLPKGQFAQNLKNEFDIYENVYLTTITSVSNILFVFL